MANKLENYPNVTLVINQGVPSVELRQSTDNIRRLLVGPSLTEMLLQIAQQIGFTGTVTEILELIGISDELYLQFPISKETDEAVQDSIDFSAIYRHLDSELTTHQQVTGQSPELNKQLQVNWQGDVLASVLEEAYNILIIETLTQASQMGIGIIQLHENLGDPRLREKMSKELAKLDTQLVLV